MREHLIVDFYMVQFKLASMNLQYKINIRKSQKMSQKYVNSSGLFLAYYPIRGTVQVCRLLCQYLHIPYKDVYFTPRSWQDFKATEAVNWNYQELPFLKEQSIIITQTFPICMYIINKANRLDLLGATTQDKAKVDMFVFDNEIIKQMLSLFITLKDESMQKKIMIFGKFWTENIRERLLKLQKQATNTFYLPYLTVVDFYIYDIFYFFSQKHPQLLGEFPKLKQIYQKIANIHEISQYQNSNKAVKALCPAEFCQKWKSKCANMSDKCQ